MLAAPATRWQCRQLPEVFERVDGFSRWCGQRLFVFLNPAKADKACSWMGAAHELGHLLLHHDAEPGSQVLEREVTALAAESSSQHAPGRRTVILARLRTRTPPGISLKALVYRRRGNSTTTPSPARSKTGGRDVA
ncbi:ImmA/IrrE family metallo-endopeptidase [Micromonospora sp. NPDC049891]|uniref:ImmA/IrrE family metallo-endopeptidase n=1 Tax=Micromonospora sp. NPDC049891 TaxID=3155655 RepID=UPI0033E8B442